MKIARFKAENINEKLYLLELMRQFANLLDTEERSLRVTFKITGQKQATKWDPESKGRVPLWEDEEETIPTMTDKWEDVPKEDEEYSPEDKMRLKVIDALRTALANAC